ncbi:MAG: hypothetical protein ABFD04_10800 [Syntrophomonas sp.]
MNLLTRDDLTDLMHEQDEICISMYMPTCRAGTETQQGKTRLRNLLRDTQAELINRGLSSSEIKHFLKPVQELVSDKEFWQHQRDGLAIFLSSHMFYHFSLPMSFNEFMLVGQRFHLKPLLPWLSGDGLFYLLALSQNQVRFFRCTRASVQELEVSDIPHSLSEALQYDDPERQLQYHSNTLEGTNTRAAVIFHGQGANPRDSKDNILRFFRLIDRGLHSILREEKAPLVLAGVEFLFSIYQEANTYPFLTGHGIPGNPEELSAEDLQTLAWPVVEHYFYKAEQEALTYYGPYTGTDRTSHDVSEAVPAAYNGQVEILFLSDGAEQWGRFDEQTNQVLMHRDQEPGDQDLYDFTAIQTIMNGGSVYIMNSEKIPDGREMAALFRY